MRYSQQVNKVMKGNEGIQGVSFKSTLRHLGATGVNPFDGIINIDSRPASNSRLTNNSATNHHSRLTKHEEPVIQDNGAEKNKLLVE